MDVNQIKLDTIFEMRSGSWAYGTNIETSDEDFRGVCIPRDKGYYYGWLKKFEQQEGGWDEDKVIYDLRKAMKLMADGNPNMVDMLFCREEDIITKKKWWDRVLEHRERFLSRKMRHTYGGYAFAQLKRIKRHRQWLISPPKKKPERADYGLPETKLIGADQQGAFQWLLTNLMQQSVEWFKLSEELREELQGVHLPGVVQATEVPPDVVQLLSEATNSSTTFIHSVMMEKKYTTAMNHWRSYEKWKKTRNHARFELENKFGYDTKHAMHLVRLMRMGVEILTDGTVNIYRPDHEELVAIRRGAWKYEELLEYAEVMDKKLAKLYNSSPLPKQPNRVFLDTLTQDIIEDYLNGWR